MVCNIPYTSVKSGTLYPKFTHSALQASQILRPTSQQSPFSEVMHYAVLLQISKKTSPIVEPGPKFLISGVYYKERTIGTTATTEIIYHKNVVT